MTSGIGCKLVVRNGDFKKISECKYLYDVFFGNFFLKKIHYIFYYLSYLLKFQVPIVKF